MFDRSNLAASTQSILDTTPATPTGRVLLRFVNAGLRSHTPSVVGAPMTLLAEDGNKLPGIPKVQSVLLLPAGETYDVTIQPKLSGSYTAATYAVFDRMLGLSTNNSRDGGMQSYIKVAGGGSGAGSSASQQSALAVNDNYKLSAIPLVVGSPAKGVIANDKGVYGVTISSSGTLNVDGSTTLASGATIRLSPDGTFNYTPPSGATIATFTADSFTYCANGTVTAGACSSGLTATVNIAACTGTCVGDPPVANADSYTAALGAGLPR